MAEDKNENGTSELKRAKKLIDTFCKREYGEKGNFDDLGHVSLAYTEYEEEKFATVSVYADLNAHEIIYVVNDDTVKIEPYASIKDMCDNAFEYMDFDGLVETALDAAGEYDDD